MSYKIKKFIIEHMKLDELSEVKIHQKAHIS